MTVTPPPLTRPPHLLPALSWEPPYDDVLDPETGPGAPPRARTARATTTARAGWQPWSRALVLSFAAERSARGP